MVFLRPQRKAGMFLQIDYDHLLLNPYPLHHLLTFAVCGVLGSHSGVVLCGVMPVDWYTATDLWQDRTAVLLRAKHFCQDELTLYNKALRYFETSVTINGHGATSHQTFIFIFLSQTSRCVAQVTKYLFMLSTQLIVLYYTNNWLHVSTNYMVVPSTY